MISIVIPTYNSEKIITTLCNHIQNYISLDDEIIIINDCSTDNTEKKLNSVKKLYSNIKVINLSNNIGQVGATLLGIKIARGTFVITMDDDFQHHPKFIPILINELENSDSKFVVAKWDADETFMRNFGSLLFTKISSLVILKSSNFRNTAFRAFTYEIKEEFLDFFISRFWIDPRRLRYKGHQVNIEHNSQKFRPYSTFRSRLSLALKHIIFDSYLLQIIYLIFFFKNYLFLITFLTVFSILQLTTRGVVSKKRYNIYKYFN